MAHAYDLVIRGGTVVDGTGGVPFAGDVAIKGGYIALVGEVPESGAEEVDATDRYVTPGFVDVHTHYDGQITWENRLAPSSDHGVTTVVMGNCGVGFAPVRTADHQLMIKLMEGVEDIPEVVMAAGVPFNWESFPQYLDALAQRESDIDFAAQLPHSPLRVYVMGERGANLEAPTEKDLSAMRRLTCEAIEAGALGVTTSRNLAHRFRDGTLAPSVSTEEQELQALALGLRDAGAGVFQILPNSDASAASEFGLMRRLAETSGRPLSFSLLQTPGRFENWHFYRQALKNAQEQGLRIHGQFYPRPIGVLLGLDLSYHPFSLNPSYAEIADLPLAERVAAMRTPELRARLLSETPQDPNPFFVSVVKRTESLFPLGDPPNYHPAPEQSISSRARAMNVPELDLIYDELLKQDGHSILYAPSDKDVGANIERARSAFDNPGTVLGLGDGGAHYGMICDAAYTTYVLTQWLDRSDLAGSLPMLVRGLTRIPAESVGLLDRGLLRAGYKADLNIIDLDHLELKAPRVSTDLPAGGRRLSQCSTGYFMTVVSGRPTYRDGAATGALPGRLIRGAQEDRQGTRQR